MHNERAPRGWVEIQRDDSPADGAPALPSDDWAAVLVCAAAKVPGMAFCYVLGASVAIPISVIDGDATPETTPQMVADCLPTVSGPYTWIAVVPAYVARKAGLRFSREAIGT